MKTEAYKRAESAELIYSCCAAVYLNQNGPSFQRFCDERGFRAVMIENGNAAACVFSNSDVIVAVVRGTDDEDDWRMNFKSRRMRKYIGAGKVGIGFGAYFGLIRRKLIAEIETEFKHSARSVLIGGHSLGATSAVYLAHELSAHVPFDLLAIDGGPRPGNKEFCEYMDRLLNGRLIQLRRKGDVVPCVPPYLGGHRHLKSHLAYIDVFGKFHRNLSPFWQVVNRVAAITAAHVTFSGLRVVRLVVKEDHSASAYAADVRRSLDSTSHKSTDWTTAD